MQNALMPRTTPPLGRPTFQTAPDRAPHHREYGRNGNADQQFVAMLDSYRCSGGLARGKEVASMFRRHNGSNLALLAGWIINREVIFFEWQSKMWLPLFQFNRLNMTPQPGLSQLLAELGAIYSPWELATWFAQPNVWLEHNTPADTFAANLPAVLNAARTGRFIAHA